MNHKLQKGVTLRRATNGKQRQLDMSLEAHWPAEKKDTTLRLLLSNFARTLNVLELITYIKGCKLLSFIF